MAQDIANLMDKMHEDKLFGRALFIADTCQAFTLFDKVTTPNVLSLGTSLIGESAYAHHCKFYSTTFDNFHKLSWTKHGCCCFGQCHISIASFVKL